MNDTPVEQWLVARVAGVPPGLRARMASAVKAAPQVGEPDVVLRAAADALLAEATRCECRDAQALLAADALITYACEAMAERNVRGLAGLS